MNLKWLGHASFLITAADGTKIVTDPYTPETAGYAPFTEPAHVAIGSSGNDTFHCRTDLIPGDPVQINALEVARDGGSRAAARVTIRAIEAFEAYDHRYHDPDANALYRFTVDDIAIGHMGDIGNPLTDAQIDFFAGLDILLALTGGHPTIALDDLKTAIDRIQPKIVVPMHFRTLTCKLVNILWIESFLAYFPPDAVDFAFAPDVTLTPTALPASTRVLVLDYVHGC